MSIANAAESCADREKRSSKLVTPGYRSGRIRALDRAGSRVTSTPTSKSWASCFSAWTTIAPILAGDVSCDRSCITLGARLPLTASSAPKSRSWVKTTNLVRSRPRKDFYVRSFGIAHFVPVGCLPAFRFEYRHPVRRQIHVNEDSHALLNSISRSSDRRAAYDNA